MDTATQTSGFSFTIIIILIVFILFIIIGIYIVYRVNINKSTNPTPEITNFGITITTPDGKFWAVNDVTLPTAENNSATYIGATLNGISGMPNTGWTLKSSQDNPNTIAILNTLTTYYLLATTNPVAGVTTNNLVLANITPDPGTKPDGNNNGNWFIVTKITEDITYYTFESLLIPDRFIIPGSPIPGDPNQFTPLIIGVPANNNNRFIFTYEGLTPVTTTT